MLQLFALSRSAASTKQGLVANFRQRDRSPFLITWPMLLIEVKANFLAIIDICSSEPIWDRDTRSSLFTPGLQRLRDGNVLPLEDVGESCG